MTTIYEVSRLAGVSLATVSRVINGSDKVTEKTRKRVTDAMQTLGYQPNSIAQSLASNRSNSIGVLVSEFHGPFYGTMLSGMESELRKARKHVVVAAGHSDAEMEKEAIEFLISRRCDALILHVDALSDEYLVRLSESTTPIVFINRLVPELSERCISSDNEMGGYLAGQALLQKGHQNFACITGPRWKADTQARLAGFQRALQEKNIALPEASIYEGDFRETSGCKGIKQLLKAHPQLTAVFCCNDQMASGAYEGLRELGIAIPDQFSVVGYDDTAVARYLYPKLTTVHNPVENMGRMASRWILTNLYEQQGLDVERLFLPWLVERESVSDAIPRQAIGA